MPCAVLMTGEANATNVAPANRPPYWEAAMSAMRLAAAPPRLAPVNEKWVPAGAFAATALSSGWKRSM